MAIKPKPGDVIEITGGWAMGEGERFTVTECPAVHLGSSIQNCVWIKSETRVCYLSNGMDWIIISPHEQPHQLDSVDKSLRDQRDDNLRSIFG